MKIKMNFWFLFLPSPLHKLIYCEMLYNRTDVIQHLTRVHKHIYRTHRTLHPLGDSSNSKLRVHYTRVLNFISVSCRMCRMHNIFDLFIILLFKISFFANFVLFGSLKTRDIFLPSLNFSHNYRQQNFINAFF